MTMTDQSTTTTDEVLDEFTHREGEAWRLVDREGKGITQVAWGDGPFEGRYSCPDLDESRAWFDGLRCALIDGVLPPAPDGHVSLRSVMEAGGTPTVDQHYDHDDILLGSHGPLEAAARAHRFHYYTAVTVDREWPRHPDHDDEQHAAFLAGQVSRAHWGNEVLENADIREWFIASMDPAEKAKILAEQAEDAEIEARPFEVVAEPGTFRCGITGTEHAGNGLRIMGRGWIGDTVRDAADRMAFSPVALLASLPVGDPIDVPSEVAALTTLTPEEVAHLHALARRMNVIKDLITDTANEAMPLLEKLQGDVERTPVDMPDAELTALYDATGAGHLHDAGQAAADWLPILSGETKVAWLHEVAGK